jgi:hypothetical protein
MSVRGKKTAILQPLRTKEDNGNNHALFPSPQRIPQYIEVPPNIEAKQIVLYFSDVFSCSSNPLLLEDDSKLLILSGCWQAICNTVNTILVIKGLQSRSKRTHSVVRKESNMLWTIGVILLILWLLGFLGGYTGGGLIHILLVIAIVVVLIRVIQGRKIL